MSATSPTGEVLVLRWDEKEESVEQKKVDGSASGTVVRIEARRLERGSCIT